MAQVQVTLTATVSLTIKVPDSNLKKLVVDGDIDFHNYIDVSIQNNLFEDFKKLKVLDSSIYIDEPSISSWESIEKNDGTQMEFDGYKLAKL